MKFRWQRYCLLSALNNTIRGYGQKDNGLLFSRLKFNLKAVCDSIIEGDMFMENFIHSIMIHCLHNAMRSIDEELNTDSKPFRLLYSPSVMNLLNLLNVFRRSSCTDVELTDSTLLTERVGCMLGALLVQHTKMVRKANEVISGIRLNCCSGCDVNKIIGFNDDNVSIDHESPTILQMKLTAVQVMFDLYKLISIELHGGNKGNFFSCCPTCTNDHLMKEDYQILIDSVRESVPMKNVMCSKDPLRHEHMSMGVSYLWKIRQELVGISYLRSLRSSI